MNQKALEKVFAVAAAADLPLIAAILGTAVTPLVVWQPFGVLLGVAVLLIFVGAALWAYLVDVLTWVLVGKRLIAFPVSSMGWEDSEW